MPELIAIIEMINSHRLNYNIEDIKYIMIRDDIYDVKLKYVFYEDIIDDSTFDRIITFVNNLEFINQKITKIIFYYDNKKKKYFLDSKFKKLINVKL